MRRAPRTPRPRVTRTSRTSAPSCGRPRGCNVSEATEAVGVSAAHAELLRIGHCAVVMLPRAGLVARIGRPGYPLERLAAELRFALYVHEAGVPALRPAVEVADRPIPTSQGPVTFWPLLRAVDD